MFASPRRLALALAATITWTVSAAADEPSTPTTAAIGSVSTPAASSVKTAPTQIMGGRNPRVLFITAKDSPRSDEALARLRRSGGDFELMRARGWKIGEGPENHLQIVDKDALAEWVARLEISEFPTVACVHDGEILRSFKSGCTTPLDAWTFGFLAKGVDERPPGSVPEAAQVETTGHYPLRGNHWSVDEDWNPSRDKVVGHLRGPNHGHQIQANYAIESWSYEELRSLHDNLHEQEMGGVSYGARQQSSNTSNTFSAARKAGGH